MQRAEIVLDNPILTKHLRSQLRVMKLVPWVVVVAVLCLSVLWAGQAFNLFNGLGLVSFLLLVQFFILALGGMSQIGAAVSGARVSGILEFHRVSPVPPHWMAIGYFLGAPIREYLLSALVLPFGLFCAAMSPYGVLNYLQSVIALLAISWCLHALALLTALSTRKPRAGAPRSYVGMVLAVIFFGQPAGWFLSSSSARLLSDTMPTIDFFALKLPWLLFVLLYAFTLLGFLLLAASRKMRADQSHAFSKVQAVAALATLTFMLLGAFWTYHGQDFLVLTMIYVLVLASIVLTLTITPDQAEYIRGLRRADRKGLRRPSSWSDAGTNRWALMLMCAIVLIGASVTWEVIVGRKAGEPSTYSLTIAVAVFVVAYFGLGSQYFQLRLAKSGQTIMTLFVVLIWLVPILIGSITAVALIRTGFNDRIYQAILGLSPITGIAISSGLGGMTGSDAARMAALAPAITFAFVFNYLLVAWQRKLDRAVRDKTKHRIASPFDDLDNKPAESNGDGVVENARGVASSG